MTRHKRKGGGGGKQRTEIDGLWTSLGATEISFFFFFSPALDQENENVCGQAITSYRCFTVGIR